MRPLSFLCIFVFLACSNTSSQKDVPKAPTGVFSAEEGSQKDTNSLLAVMWAEENVTPAPKATDAEFFRRASLDLIGRIPTAKEARSFLTDKTENKRKAMVDSLLKSEEFAEHWATIYFDLLIGSEARQLRRFDAPKNYLKTSFAENKPFDQMTREILTATGDVSENGAGAFLVANARKGGGPETVAASTSRLFLGVQIQCAQCHDHPYDDRYKQEDFYGFVAYFMQTRAKANKEKKSIRLFDTPRRRARMKKGGFGQNKIVAPKFLGKSIIPKENETRRETLTRAILSSDLFAKTFVNRTWSQLFGSGILEPWDDLGGENDKSHPVLLRTLSEDFVNNGYNVKRLLKQMVLSDAYALSSRGPAGPEHDPALLERVFARAPIRPLSPNQLFRSLFEATQFDDVLTERRGEDRVKKMKERALREYLFVFGNDEMAEVDTFNGNTPQALLLFNGEITNFGVLAGPNSMLQSVLASTPETNKRIEELFLITYARYPDEAEMTKFSSYVEQAKNARKAYEDLFFAMLTSTEFLTNH